MESMLRVSVYETDVVDIIKIIKKYGPLNSHRQDDKVILTLNKKQYDIFMDMHNAKRFPYKDLGKTNGQK